MKTKYKIVSLLTIICVYGAFFLFSSRYASDSVDYSGLARIEMYNKVLDVEYLSLIGTGIGGYSQYINGEDVLSYPHNIFLETYVEIGLIGITLLSFVIYVLYKRKNFNCIFFMFCFYYFLNALVSGDINGNNYFFIFAALVLLSNKGGIKKL